MEYEEAKLIIKEFNDQYGEGNLFVKRLEEAYLTKYSIARVILILQDICHYCYNNNSNCNCMRDE